MQLGQVKLMCCLREDRRAEESWKVPSWVEFNPLTNLVLKCLKLSLVLTLFL